MSWRWPVNRSLGVQIGNSITLDLIQLMIILLHLIVLLLLIILLTLAVIEG